MQQVYSYKKNIRIATKSINFSWYFAIFLLQYIKNLPSPGAESRSFRGLKKKKSPSGWALLTFSHPLTRLQRPHYLNHITASSGMKTSVILTKTKGNGKMEVSKPQFVHADFWNLSSTHWESSCQRLFCTYSFLKTWAQQQPGIQGDENTTKASLCCCIKPYCAHSLGDLCSSGLFSLQLVLEAQQGRQHRCYSLLSSRLEFGKGKADRRCASEACRDQKGGESCKSKASFY